MDLHEHVGMTRAEPLGEEGEWIGTDEQWAEYNRLSAVEMDGEAKFEDEREHA